LGGERGCRGDTTGPHRGDIIGPAARKEKKGGEVGTEGVGRIQKGGDWAKKELSHRAGTSRWSKGKIRNGDVVGQGNHVKGWENK